MPSIDWPQDVSVFMLDLDGVIFRGRSVIPRAPEAVRTLRLADAGLFFVTNNSTSITKMIERLRDDGRGFSR